MLICRRARTKTIFATGMKNFRTVINPDKLPFSISHADKLMSIGSCFSENIGKKFTDYKFTANVNPFGQQYNPHSIALAIHLLLNPVNYQEDDLIFHDELFHSFDHHGSFSDVTPQAVLHHINENLQKAAVDLQNATVLFLTFGTSHVFEWKQSGKIVSNCHKLSGNHFNRRLMPPDEIVTKLSSALQNLIRVKPEIKIVLTVSPVRYFAFGVTENSVSKAHLFTAIHQIQKLHSECCYFPAYELVMDDLRDYRFFAEDMLHPNYQATDYVWQKLCDSLIEPATILLMRQMDEIFSAVRHKPRNSHSEAHEKFVRKYMAKIEAMQKNTHLNFAQEMEALKSTLR